MEDKTTFMVEQGDGDLDKVWNNCIKVVKTWYVIHTKCGGYSKNELNFHLFDDGQMAISDPNKEAVYLTIEQIDALKKFLSGDI